MHYTTFNVAGLDLVEISLYLFFGFFFFLILYLQRESRREGYPLEEDTSGRVEKIEGFLWWPAPKTFALPHGHGAVTVPNSARETRPLALKRTAVWPGAPLEPTGDAGKDGVGPGSYAQRAKIPDMMHDGSPKIAPLSRSAGFSILKGDADPAGFTAVGVDGKAAGTVTDVWIDRGEHLIRYIEVQVADGGKVLLPMPMAEIKAGSKTVVTDSVRGDQFAGAPRTAKADQVTMDEEERIAAYFGAGYLYATPTRAEPLA